MRVPTQKTSHSATPSVIAMLPTTHFSTATSVVLSLLLALSMLSSTQAANGSWLSGQTGTRAWDDASNWTSGTIPGATSGITNGDTATFGTNTAATLITVDSGRLIGSLLFNGTDAAGLYTLGSEGVNLGNALHLASGGNLTSALGTTVGITLHAPLVLQPASSTGNGTYSILNNSTNLPNEQGDTNLYKIQILGDVTGGTTTGSITLTLGGTAGNRTNNNSANTLSGLISDGGAQGGLSLFVTGADGGNRGAWAVTNPNNSFTGSLTLQIGTLIVPSMANAGENSAIGAGSVIQLNSNAQFKYTGPAVSIDRTLNSNGGIIYAVSNPITLTGPVAIAGMTFRGSSNFIVDTVITGTGNLSRTDGGTVFLNRDNTFNGGVTIQDGAFRIASIANQGIASPLGAGSFIQFGQNSGTVGRLEFTGASGGSSDREIRLNNGNGASSGNGRINNTVAGQTLTLSGTIRATSATATHIASLNLTGVGNGILSGIIGGTVSSPNTPNNLSLTKDGSGTWALTAANIYYGPNSISQGVLLAMNTTGSATGTGNVTTSGSGVLAGTGTVSPAAGGSITLNAGSSLRIGTTHAISAGGAGPVGYTSAPGTLTLGSLGTNVAMTLGSNLQFDLFSSSDGITPGSADLLRLRSSATSITLGGIVQVADTTGGVSWQRGTWQLVDWSGITGTKSGTFTYSLPTAPLASGYDWNTSSFLDTGSLFIEKVALNHTWTGTESNSWANVGNWEVGTLPTGSTDVFFTNATSNLTHRIDGDKTVRNMLFSGESNNTIETGSGGVLYVNGSLIEVLGGTQSFAAMIRPRGTSGTELRIVNNGTLNFNNQIMLHRASGTDTVNYIFSGTGTTSVNYFSRRVATYDAAITVNGPGTLVLTSATSTPAPVIQSEGSGGFITGTTTVNGGVLSLNQEGNLGGNPAIFNAAHLTLNGGTLLARATFALDDENRGVTFGPTGATVQVEPGHSLTLATAIAGPGSLSKTGTGTLVLAAPSTHTGPTHVQTGSLHVGLVGIGSTGTGALSLDSGTTLLGTGTVRSSTFTAASGSTVHVGDATAAGTFGTLTFAPDVDGGTLDFQSGSTVSMDLALNGSHDQLVFTGLGTTTLVFDSSLILGPTSLTPSSEMSFQLFDWSGLASMPTFASHFHYTGLLLGNGDEASGLNLPDLSGSGYLWDISQLTTLGSIAIVVPEPSRTLLLTLATTALLLRRHRRRDGTSTAI